MTASIPVWPFFLLAGLLMLGYRQSRDRIVRPSMLAKVALGMVALSLFGVTAAFGASVVPVLAWALTFTAAIVFGGPAFAPRGLAKEGAAVRMPGSWVPLGLMLGIFMTKFGLGFATGMGAHVLQEVWFGAAVSAALGLFSGAFAARAMAVHRFVRTA